MNNSIAQRKPHSCNMFHLGKQVVTIILMLLMMNTEVGGQTDYSGTYYIGSVDYNANKPAENYYLCPTEGWCYYKPDDDFSSDGTTYPNPFLTTYKCKTNAYNSGVNNAVWVIEKHPTQDFYYIKHALDGKYIVSNGIISDEGPDRMRIHLEAINLESLDDKALFSITPYPENNPSYLVISPKGITDAANLHPDHGNHKWLTVNGGNKDSLKGAKGKTGGPKGYENTAGIVGIWTIEDTNAKFYLEKATIDPPTFTNNFDGTITITATTGATIYYTTDGSAPTTSSPNSGTTPINVSITANTEVVKAIAKGTNDYFPTIVTTYKIPKCAKPIITPTADGNHVTIACPTSGASITYTTDSNAEPTTPYTIGDQIDVSNASVIKAQATSLGYLPSDVASYSHLIVIHSSSDITNMEGNYALAVDFESTAAIGTMAAPFTGTIDGQFHAIHEQTVLGHPLVAYANGATIKNITIGKVNIPSGTNVGAICGVADGDTKIYNCGVLDGSVSGSANVGGLVGLIKSDSEVRVVNCFNYANVSGGSNGYAAGIVGKNEGTIGDTRIALCMMYGNVTGSTNISPVYATEQPVSNEKTFTEYNYWLYSATDAQGNKVLKDLQYTSYNAQLAIEKDEYLTRFPFYRHILNTHRELASFFLFNDYATEHVSEIGHWAVNKSKAPYPIIEIWKSNTKRTTVDIEENLPNTSEERKGKLLQNMGSSGYITVNVYINGEKVGSPSLPITDMNEENYDYTWGKVVLPFANEFSGWTRDYDYVCTGWEITKVGSEESASVSNYNFADRDNKNKDIYDKTNNPYIFAQGGNYIVPYGVSSIDINAHFAKAYYLSDPTYDMGYSASYSTAANDIAPLGGYVYGSNDPYYHGKKVYTSLSALVQKLSSTLNPNDQAIVLVGNYHYIVNDGANNEQFNKEKAVTIMSTDEDCNQEPDYGWYMCNKYGRLEVPPLRFDFVPNIEMGMSSRVGSNMYPGIGIWHTRGWFELTETCISNMSQCEINSDNFTNNNDGKGNNRWIANSGRFVQIVRARDGNCSKLSYIQIGGNAYVKELYPGSHSDKALTSTAVPIVITGGQIDECCMTGYSTFNNNGAKLKGDMIYFWCAGGKIKKFLGAYLEEPIKNTKDIGLTAKIDHALIGRFFGGGTSASARIKGDIDVTINNSIVDFYCGGPEFGDMYTGKKVTTHATGTTFGEFYGAGFGGTSITYNRKGQTPQLDINTQDETTYDLEFSLYNNFRLRYDSNFGIGNCYKFEYIFNSNGTKGVSRFHTGYARFSLATTGNVRNELTNCFIKKLPGENSPTPKKTSGDFYGAGCQGKVNGKVESTLTGCTVEGNAYGGGFKAVSNEVEVYTKTQPTYSKYKKETGIFSDFKEEPGIIYHETFTWKQGKKNGKKNEADEANKILYTDIEENLKMSELGNVTDTISITINGGSITGNVFGGGNESKSQHNTIVVIKSNASIGKNVYGGGNVADVGGDTNVNLLGGTITGNVYGGGQGSLGKKDADNPEIYTEEPVAALVGSTEVNLNGSIVKGNIFGCNNLNGTPKGSVTVNIYKTVGYEGHMRTGANAETEEAREAALSNIDVNQHTYELNTVYGGGNLAAYEPTETTAHTQVNIYGCGETSIHQVYGGGNAASTPGTQVDVYGTYEIGEVFGGGNGKDDISHDGGLTHIKNPGANVGFRDYWDYTNEKDLEAYDTKEERQEADFISNYVYGSGEAHVNIHGGRVHRVYGGSNTKGNVKKVAITMLEDTSGCTFKVDQAYGGGKSAPMDGESILEMSCMPGLSVAYGGAEAADIHNNVTLNITNGNFDRVFGGNNVSGQIHGTITVNIEETGCHPIIIGQLFGGGNQATYEAPWKNESNHSLGRQDGPTINVRSFTSIGEVYGGGYGETAKIIGDTHVNINVCESHQTWGPVEKISENTGLTKTISFTQFKRTTSTSEDNPLGFVYAKDEDGNYLTDNDGNRIRETEDITLQVFMPEFKTGQKMGAINNIYGGGYGAEVNGSTYVNIGTTTGENVVYNTPTDASLANRTHQVKGANITGNVFGAGYGTTAKVTGNTNVQIGK